MNTVGRSHTFRAVPTVKIGRSKFNRSHGLKTTLNGGYLVPIYLDQVLPGDSVRINYNHLLRMTTPLAPFMDNVKATVFFFHIPRRLVWDNFESYITGSERGKLGTTHVKMPQITLTKADLADNQTLFDYLGLPTGITGDSITVNALPLRCYNLVYNEWFRHEDICELIPEHHGDDGDKPADYVLRKRVKRGDDPFTTCLPWPQKGPDVSIPLSGNAPVVGNGIALGLTNGTISAGMEFYSGDTSRLTASSGVYGSAVGSAFVKSDLSSSAAGVTSDPEKSGLVADMSNVASATINDLRQAFQVQRLYERSARSGSRYVEALLAHWGVRSPDARL